ncbi:MAG: PaaI family thioesterase [Cellvibrionaceae bacterium]
MVEQKRVSKTELMAFMENEFPQCPLDIDSIGDRACRVRRTIGFQQLRPGGTVSGPVLMEVADAAMYVAILSEIGLVALAVTTSLNINFLRKPDGKADVIAECKLLKLGKRLVVGEVFLFSEGDDDAVAHVTATYSIPPQS